jgi:hypothetical protein
MGGKKYCHGLLILPMELHEALGSFTNSEIIEKWAPQDLKNYQTYKKSNISY